MRSAEQMHVNFSVQGQGPGVGVSFTWIAAECGGSRSYVMIGREAVSFPCAVSFFYERIFS